MILKYFLTVCVFSFAFLAVPQAQAQDVSLPGKTLKNTGEVVHPGADNVVTPIAVDTLNQSSGSGVTNSYMPAENILQPPAPTPMQVPPPDMAQDGSVPVAVPPVPENIFYDSQSLVPQTELSRKGVPRKLNPRVEPASKYIVVKKNKSAVSTDARLVAADRALKLGRYDSAVAMYDELYKKHPKDANVLLGRAIVYQNLGREEEALRAYDKLLELKPGMIDAEVNMLGLMAQKYPSVALERLMKLWDTNSDNVAVAAQIAVVQGKLGRYDEAVRYLGIASSLEPQNANHIYNMAVISDRAGAKSEAIEYYEKALEVDSVYGGGRTIPRSAVFERLSSLR